MIKRRIMTVLAAWFFLMVIFISFDIDAGISSTSFTTSTVISAGGYLGNSSRLTIRTSCDQLSLSMQQDKSFLPDSCINQSETVIKTLMREA